SMGRTGQQLTEVLRAEPPSRLRIINEEQLQAMGVPAALIQKFLDHPAFTPRHDTVIVAALSQLDGVKGRDMFIELCLRAQAEVWTTGRSSKRLKQEAAARGFKITENVEKTVAITQ